MSEQLDANGLCQAIGIDRRRLQQFLKQGMPHAGRGQSLRFDAEAVRLWLLSAGLGGYEDQPAAAAAPPPADSQSLVATQPEVAKHFGVSVKTVQEWIARHEMPRTADGRFDLAAIALWREARFGRQQQGDRLSERALYETRIARAKAEREEIELARLRGQLVEIDAPSRVIERTTATARALLEPFPERFARYTPSEARRAFIDEMRGAIDDVLRSLQQGNLEWAQELADAQEGG